MVTIVLYPKEFDLEHFLFHWPCQTKMRQIYQRILKEVNGYQNYLGFPDLRDNNFEVMRKSISLNKVGLVCADTVREKLP